MAKGCSSESGIIVFETENRPERRSTQQILPLEHPDCLQIAFDDHRLVNNAGLLIPATLARHVGLRELVDRDLDLGDAPGRANAGDKMLTLVARRWRAATALTTPRRCAWGGPSRC